MSQLFFCSSKIRTILVGIRLIYSCKSSPQNEIRKIPPQTMPGQISTEALSLDYRTIPQVSGKYYHQSSRSKMLASSKFALKVNEKETICVRTIKTHILFFKVAFRQTFQAPLDEVAQINGIEFACHHFCILI